MQLAVMWALALLPLGACSCWASTTPPGQVHTVQLDGKALPICNLIVQLALSRTVKA